MKMYTDFPDYRQFVQTYFTDHVSSALSSIANYEAAIDAGIEVSPGGEIVITGPIGGSPADGAVGGGAVGDGIDSGFLPGVNIPITEAGGEYS